PKKTIQAGIGAAAAAQPAKDVYVSKGVYNETPVLADGVSVFGGYDASAKGARAAADGTGIDGTGAVGVTAANLTKLTELQLLTIKSQDASGQGPNGDGASSIGVRVLSSSSFVIRGCTITAGVGTPGALGGAGGVGGPGGGGGNASGTSP